MTRVDVLRQIRHRYQASHDYHLEKVEQDGGLGTVSRTEELDALDFAIQILEDLPERLDKAAQGAKATARRFENASGVTSDLLSHGRAMAFRLAAAWARGVK